MQGRSPAAAAGNRTRSARRRSREFAMQGIYQWLLSAEDIGAIQAHIETSPGFDKADRSHFDTLLKGTISQAILMQATFELKDLQEIPYRVVINEAVELAKNFGGTDGYKYVNGVLDRIAPSVRPHEVRPAG